MKGQQANLVLIASGCGVLAAYPFHGSFFGGMLTATFTAATVGGLADWFAVEALFRKPLGIPYRTEVIARNRQRIFKLLAQTVQQDLLQTDNIRQHLKSYDLLGALLRLLATKSGKRQLRRAVYGVLSDLLRPKNGLAKQGVEFLRSLLKEWVVAPQALAWLTELTENGKDEAFWTWLLEKAALWCESPVLAAALSEWAETALKRYGQGGAMRELAVSLAELDPKVLGLWAQQELRKLVAELGDETHPWRMAWRSGRGNWLLEKRKDAAFLAEVENWKEKLLLARSFDEKAATLLTGTRQAVWLTRRICIWLESRQNALLEDVEKRAMLNQKGKEIFLAWLERNHAEIGRTVLENLQRFSDQDLVEMIESRTGDDLQMIRINGAVVGGLAGLTLYLINLLF